jgi:hypothetical protein
VGDSGTTANFNFNNNQMYLRGDGKLGLGTTAPSYMFDIVSPDTTGLMELTGNNITTGTGVGIVLDGLTTGTGFDMSVDALTSGSAFKINSTSTALTTGQLMSLDWSPTGSSEIFATGDLFKINIGSLGNIGNLFGIYDNGSDVFKVSQSQITSAVPHAFTSSGDVSIANDLVMTDQFSSTIKSDGPLTIQSGENFENLDLVLKPSGNGSVVVDDGNDLEVYVRQKIALDADDNADSYILYRDTTPSNRVELWVDGVESMRWRAGAASGTAPLVEANGSVISSAFDLAEIYPTNDSKLEAGDIVVVSQNAQQAGASYLVEKSNNENKSNVVGIVSTKPGLLMGGSSFYSDFCSLATSGAEGEQKAREQARGEATAQQKALESNFNESGATPVNSDAVNEAVEDKINLCKALRQVPVALTALPG